MEALVVGMVHQSARTLGLSLTSPKVREAEALALNALACGQSVEAAHDFARHVLLKDEVSAMPHLVAA
jgi:hypothetical protein